MNTQWIVGCCVYSGLDTKLMQNQNKSRYKQSRLDQDTNKTVVRIIIFVIVVCILLGLSDWSWYIQYGDAHFYLEIPVLGYQTGSIKIVLNTLTAFCLNNTFIPISLYVAVEIAKAT